MTQRLEKYLNLEGFLEKSLKTKYALKSTGKSLKGLEMSLNSSIFHRTTLLIEIKISIKLLCLLPYLVQQILQQIKAQQFYTDKSILFKNCMRKLFEILEHLPLPSLLQCLFSEGLQGLDSLQQLNVAGNLIGW